MYCPQQYSKNLGPFVEIARVLFQKHSKLLKWNPEPESIMDLGIGDGRMTKEVVLPIVPKNIEKYIGADISEPMLQSARQTIINEKFETMQMDITTKNIQNEMKNRFHHIFSNNCFHLISNIRQTFINVQYILKPGGQLFFTTMDKLYFEGAYDILDDGKWSKYNNRKAHSAFYFCENPLKEYESLAKNLGFVNCYFSLENFKPQVTEESFEELIVAGNICLPYVKQEDKEAYIKDHTEAAKKLKPVKLFTDEHNRKMVEISMNVITGVISKPD